MRELLDASKELSGIDDNLEAVEEVGVFLYQLFSESPEMSRSHGEAIKRQLGPYPAKVAINIANIIKRLSSHIISNDSPISDSSNDNMKEEFGHNILFTFSDNLMTDENPVPAVVNELLIDDVSSVEDDNNHQLITKGLMQGISKANRNHKQCQASKPTTSASNIVIVKYGRVWLERACEACNVQGLSWQQLYSRLFDLLISDTEGPEMENEVCTYNNNNNEFVIFIIILIDCRVIRIRSIGYYSRINDE